MSEEAPELEPRAQRTADHEVAVVGGGQAGLTMGYYLDRHGRRFVILERGSSVASAWRERWESLTLFTPRRLQRAARTFLSRAIRTAIPNAMR